MLPTSDLQPPGTSRKSKSSEPKPLDGNFSFSSLHSVLQPYFSLNNPRSWLLFSILFLQIVLIFLARILPAGTRNTAFTSPEASDHLTESNDSVIPTNTQTAEQCHSGRIFVYELPAAFNYDLIRDCDKLNPWSSRCDALLNDGFGNQATSLAGLIPDDLIPAWFWTDQFVSEIIFHKRLLNHRCRTTTAKEAAAFYVPFYAGLAVGKYLWKNYTSSDRDRHCGRILRWLSGQPYWTRSGGWDHFITMGRISWDFRRSEDHDWGSSCIYMPGMRNITRLLIERNPWDYFDVGIPYPTGFHPRSDSDVLQWQSYVRNKNRSKLFCFAGAARRNFKNDFRGLLLSQCLQDPDSCRVVNCAGSRCSNRTSAIIETFLDADFCLQPRGDSFTRRSIFDCMIAGSIPVFFWRRTAYYQYEWFLPGEPKSYSVFMHRDEVRNGTSIKAVLEKLSREEVRKMRNTVIDYIPRLVYAKPDKGLGSMKDAFDVAIDGVLRRFKQQEEPGFRW